MNKFNIGDEVWLVTNWLEGNWAKGTIKGLLEGKNIYFVEYDGIISEYYDHTIFATEDEVRNYLYDAWSKK